MLLVIVTVIGSEMLHIVCIALLGVAFLVYGALMLAYRRRQYMYRQSATLQLYLPVGFIIAGICIVSLTYFYRAAPILFALALVFATLILWGFLFVVFDFSSSKKHISASKDIEDEINTRYGIEGRLIAKNKQLEWAERTAKICYFHWNIETNEMQYSDGAEVVLGINIQQQQSFDVLKSIIIEEDKLRIRRHLESFINWNEATTIMFRGIVSGQLRYIKMIGEIFKDQHDARWVRGALQDVTEQQMFIQKIEDKNEALKQIAWMQSHEVRGPLATILGLAELIEISDLESEDTKVILNGIKEASNTLDDIVRKIVKKAEAANIELG